MKGVFYFVVTAGLFLGAMPEMMHGQELYRRGQSVQPVYEGFEENPDGSYTMWFGYLNRNYEEAPHLPLGPDNYFAVVEGGGEEGGQASGMTDRGQPTYFYPRRQQFVFGVTVPPDFGNRELVWTLKRNGAEYSARGKIAPVWVWGLTTDIWRANRGGLRPDPESTDEPPTVELVGQSTITTRIGEPDGLTVSVRDDGFPEAEGGGAGVRRGGAAQWLNALPGMTGVSGETVRQAVVSVDAARETGLAVTWLQYRGAGRVAFDPMVVPLDPIGGRASTTVRFRETGTYEIRAYADDGLYTRSAGVTVVVQESGR